MKRERILSLAMTILLLSSFCSAGGVDFKLKDLDGKSVELSQVLAQGPAVVSFWATWCHPCQDELVQVQELYKTYSDSGLGFITVSIDGAKDKSRVKSLAKGKGFTFPVLLDPEQKAMKDFGLSDVPGLFIISAKGEILYRHNGYKSGDEMEIRDKIIELVSSLRPKELVSPPDTAAAAKAVGDSL